MADKMTTKEANVTSVHEDKQYTQREEIEKMKMVNELEVKAAKIAGKYFDLVEKRIDSADELTGNALREIYEGIQMMGHITATLERFSRIGGIDLEAEPYLEKEA